MRDICVPWEGHDQQRRICPWRWPRWRHRRPRDHEQSPTWVRIWTRRSDRVWQPYRDSGWWGSTVDTIETDQGVDLEVSEVEVDVDGVETDEEVDENFFFLFGYMFQKSLSPDVTRWERCGNADIKPKGFGVDIANVDTTLVSEEDRIALTVGVDAYVEFGI
jgi:hypothetical protein